MNMTELALEVMSEMTADAASAFLALGGATDDETVRRGTRIIAEALEEGHINLGSGLLAMADMMALVVHEAFGESLSLDDQEQLLKAIVKSALRLHFDKVEVEEEA